jgi:hypothetical protein
MRLSRVLIAGAAVAAAVATTSAFTASNDNSALQASNLKAGYGEVTVTGVTVTEVTYNPLLADRSKLESVVFTATGDVSAQKAYLTLKKVTNGVPADIVSTNCTMVASTNTTITCPTASHPAIESFNTVGLTVAHALP